MSFRTNTAGILFCCAEVYEASLPHLDSTPSQPPPYAHLHIVLIGPSTFAVTLVAPSRPAQGLTSLSPDVTLPATSTTTLALVTIPTALPPHRAHYPRFFSSTRDAHLRLAKCLTWMHRGTFMDESWTHRG